MTTLHWKLNRLRLMGMPEIAYRVRQQMQKKAFRIGIGTAGKPATSSMENFGKAFMAMNPGSIDCEGLRAAADELLSGRWNVFSLKSVQLGFPPEWNKDPKTGRIAPLTTGKCIDYRDECIVGDIKYLWEPSRHLGLVTIAAAWRATGDSRYVEAAVSLLTSWMDQCPYPLGVHWASSLELAVRLLNWSVAWHLFGGENGALFRGEAGVMLKRRWLEYIYRHCHFIDNFYSKHSSANNHLFGEYMGLFIAALTWPCWKESHAWQAKAKAGLEAEALRQNGPDGVNREQAVYYHHEVMDMMLICHLAGVANGVTFSAAFMKRLETMADFLHALMDTSGNVPMFGDADDALMVCLSHQKNWCHYRSLLASCALLFQRPDLKLAAGSLDDKNRWLFGEEGVLRWAELQEEAREPTLQFPEGGYYLLGRDWGTPGEIKAIVDCAPLGYLSIAAHGHADSLSMVLSAGGDELLIDPGTYAYHTQKKWRDYFRSTGAHNTVRVDGLDQSVIGGNFMWLDKATSTLTRYIARADGQVFEGEHDGYRRLKDPVIHRRRIDFDARRQVFTVTDSIICKAMHKVEIFWHLDEKCTAAVKDTCIAVTSGTGKAHMIIATSGARATLRKGDDHEPAGWVSRRFDDKQPTTSICYAATIDGATEFSTEIAVCLQSSGSAPVTDALEPSSDKVDATIGH